MTVQRETAFLVALIDRYLGGLMDPFVSLREVQKLMYFAQEAGEPLHPAYTKGNCGPSAESVHHVLSEAQGYLLPACPDAGDLTTTVKLVPGAIDDARAFLENHPESKARFDRVARLVDGFESPVGLELLATVHWVIARGNVRAEDAVAHSVHECVRGKRNFTPRQIRTTVQRLTEEGWIRPKRDRARS